MGKLELPPGKLELPRREYELPRGQLELPGPGPELTNFPTAPELPRGSWLGPGKLNFPTEVGTSVWMF